MKAGSGAKKETTPEEISEFIDEVRKKVAERYNLKIEQAHKFLREVYFTIDIEEIENFNRMFSSKYNDVFLYYGSIKGLNEYFDGFLSDLKEKIYKKRVPAGYYRFLRNYYNTAVRETADKEPKLRFDILKSFLLDIIGTEARFPTGAFSLLTANSAIPFATFNIERKKVGEASGKITNKIEEYMRSKHSDNYDLFMGHIFFDVLEYSCEEMDLERLYMLLEKNRYLLYEIKDFNIKKSSAEVFDGFMKRIRELYFEFAGNNKCIKAAIKSNFSVYEIVYGTSGLKFAKKAHSNFEKIYGTMFDDLWAKTKQVIDSFRISREKKSKLLRFKVFEHAFILGRIPAAICINHPDGSTIFDEED